MLEIHFEGYKGNYYFLSKTIRFGKTIEFWESCRFGEDAPHIVTINGKHFDECSYEHHAFLQDREEKIKNFKGE